MIRSRLQHKRNAKATGVPDSPNRKDRYEGGKYKSRIIVIFCAIGSITILALSILALDHDASNNSVLNDLGSVRTSNSNASSGNDRMKPKPIKGENKKPVKERPGRIATTTESGIKAAADDITVIDAILKLAEMPTADLQTILDIDQTTNSSENKQKDNYDPFKLAALKKGICPWKKNSNERGSIIELDWLPERPPLSSSKWFKKRNDGKNPKKPPVTVYYEHLSKAGGTSFCELAQSNMPRKEVPQYYCMPRKGKKMDGRVGSWSKEELVTYLETKPHRILSNEWEPFQPKFLELQAKRKKNRNLKTTNDDDDDDNNDTTNTPLLLFVTSIRNPVNRLLSAYKFWGILHNGATVKPPLALWLQRLARRSNRWEILSEDFMTNVGRWNFATWKFSGGTLKVNPIQVDAEKHFSRDSLSKHSTTDYEIFSHHHSEKGKEMNWREPFKTAIHSLIHFDLAIPMELLSDHNKPLQQLLGWENFKNSHIVPSGEVLNNNASIELSNEEYDALWSANALDMILYYWATAIYLTRLHCADSMLNEQ